MHMNMKLMKTNIHEWLKTFSPFLICSMRKSALEKLSGTQGDQLDLCQLFLVTL